MTLSHTDKVVDRGYHREILASGASVEYDQGFRWKPDVDNGTLTLLAWMLEDGYGDQLMLGLDAARQGYWTTYGGSPGWTFLLGEFADAMRVRGIDAEDQQLFVTNPARAPSRRSRDRAAPRLGGNSSRRASSGRTPIRRGWSSAWPRPVAASSGPPISPSSRTTPSTPRCATRRPASTS